MFGLSFSERASDDLADIWMSIAADNSRAADQVLSRIRDACDRLRLFPYSAPAQPEIGAEARMMTVQHWLVLYRLAGTTIDVRRVVDGRRDPSSWRLGIE